MANAATGINERLPWAFQYEWRGTSHGSQKSHLIEAYDGLFLYLSESWNWSANFRSFWGDLSETNCLFHWSSVNICDGQVQLSEHRAVYEIMTIAYKNVQTLQFLHCNSNALLKSEFSFPCQHFFSMSRTFLFSTILSFAGASLCRLGWASTKWR